jgi:hypothetical protein
MDRGAGASITATDDPLTARAPSAPECLVVLLGFAMVVIGQLAATGSGALLWHPLWLDECLTQLIANDPSFRHAMAAVRAGADTNPPTRYVMLWPLAYLAGGISTTGVRIFAAVSMVLAIAGVFCTCRLFLDRGRAVIGALAVMAHPLVVAQMFEARFYGTWLAATIWLAYAAILGARAPRSPLVTVVQCTLAVLAATIHWFGAIAVALVGLAVVAWQTGSRRERAARLLPFGIAGAAALACVPYFTAQRAGMSVRTWLDPVGAGAVAEMARHLLLVPPAFVVLAYAVVRMVQAGRSVVAASDPATRTSIRGLAPALALLFFPAVLVVLSLFMQPVLLDRYLAVTVLPLGVVAALVAMPLRTRTGIALAVIACASLIGATGLEFRVARRMAAVSDVHIVAAVSTVELASTLPKPLEVVFARRFEHYPVIQLRPDLAQRVSMLDFGGVPDPRISHLTLFERDMARRASAVYPQYRLARADTLRQAAPFLIVTNSANEAELLLILKGARIKRSGPDTYFVSYPQPGGIP